MEREVYCLCELMRGKRERKEFNNSLRKDLVWEAVMGISLWIVQVIILYWVKIKYTKRSQVSWVSIWDSGLLWSWCLWGINQQWLPAEALLRINPLSTLTALCLCGYCVFMCCCEAVKSVSCWTTLHSRASVCCYQNHPGNQTISKHGRHQKDHVRASSNKKAPTQN